jgi:hypothetical protein
MLRSAVEYVGDEKFNIIVSQVPEVIYVIVLLQEELDNGNYMFYKKS